MCPAVFYDERKREKRSSHSATVTMHPRMFTLMKMKRSIQNTNPVIITSGPLRYQEDNHTFSKVHFSSYDIENDSFIYSIEKDPEHGFANITTDGWFTYQGYQDFSGIDGVKICVSEINISRPFIPTKTCKHFDIIVNSTNDDPSIDFYPDTTFPYWNTSDGGEYIIVFESNITRENEYGIFAADDIDIGNNISIGLIDFTNDTLSLWELKKSKRNKIQYNHLGTHNEMILCHHVDKEVSGLAHAEIRAHDDQLDDRNLYGYSRGITVKVYVLMNPCQNGVCVNKTDIPCSDTSRAFSFNKFACYCSLGYTGQWCETDINECQPNPCSVFYDCKNLVGHYECILNGQKTFGLAIGFLFIIGFPVLLIWRYMKKRRPSNKISDSMIWYPAKKR